MRKYKLDVQEIILLTPILLISIFLIFTIFLFLNGLISWDVQQPALIITFVMVTYSVFIAGFVYAVRRASTIRVIDFNSPNANIRVMKVVFYTAIIVSIWYFLGWLIYYIRIENLLLFITNPSKGYDYTKLIQRLMNTGYYIAVNPFFRLGFWLHLLFSGFKFLILPILYFNFNSLNRFEKTLGITTVCINLLFSWVLGLQSGFFSFMVTVVFMFIAYVCNSIYRNGIHSTQNSKTTSKIQLILVGTSIVIFLSVFTSFQYGRQYLTSVRYEKIQETTANNTRVYFNIEEIYLYSIFGCDYYTHVPTDMLDYIRNKNRLDPDTSIYNLCNLENISLKNNNSNTEIKAPPIADNKPLDSTVNNANLENKQISSVVGTNIEKVFNGISVYFEYNEDHFLNNYLTDAVLYKLTTLEMYMTHGYFGLYLALQQPITSSFPVSSLKGAEPYLSSFIDVDSLTDRSLAQKIEKENNWNSKTYWSTLLTSLLSDYYKIGTIIVMGLFGFIFGFTWKMLLERLNYIVFGLFMLFTLAALYIPLNNYIGNSLTNIITLITLFILFVVDITLLSRRNINETKN